MNIGALEAGGTKMVCAIGDENGNIIDRISLPTQIPKKTMDQIIKYFKRYDIKALGVGCFGPIDLKKESITYGYITTTPKVEWRNYDIVGTLKEALQVPIGFDTDVNASALGEATWGITQDVKSSIYITIGTGIGTGIIVEGKLLHGMLHPEAGHILIKKHERDQYEGKCPYHKSCFEGLASGPAIEDRWGKEARALSNIREVWEIEAYYIAQAIVNYVFTLSPQRIVLGGGVMCQQQLIPIIRAEVKRLLADYIDTKELREMDKYIVLASLKDNQGVMGAIKLGLDALNEQR